MNECVLIGRVTKDVELNHTTSDIPVVDFSIAIARGRDKEGKDRGADFPRIAVYGRTAENCAKYLKKGMMVAVSGQIHTGNYVNKDGNKIYTTDVIADRVEFMEWPERSEQKK